MQMDPNILFQSLGDNTYVIRCGQCAGTGHPWKAIYDTMYTQQPPREGFGWILTDEVVESMQCFMCKGKGVLKVECDDVPVIHRGCQGKGLVLKLGPDGEVWKNFPCEECSGTGVTSLTGKIRVLR